MSIATLTNSSNTTDIYCNNLNSVAVVCQNLTAANTTIQNTILSGNTILNNTLNNGTVLNVSSSSTTLSAPLINISSIDGGTQSVINISSTGTVNRINMTDTNATSFVNDISFFGTGGFAKNLQVGLNNQSTQAYIYSNGVPILFYTNTSERLRIPSTGIATDITTNEALVINGTTLSKRSDFVNLTSGQVLTNKTLTSPNINGVLTFNSKNTTQIFTGSILNATPTVFVVLDIPANSAVIIETSLIGYITVGTDINKSAARRLTSRATNIAGTVTIGGNLESLSNNDTGLNAISLSYGGSIGLGQASVIVAGLASNTFNFNLTITVMAR